MHHADDDAAQALPCMEAMVAGTLSLMTAWADPNPDAAVDLDAQRQLIARKIVSNLFFPSAPPACQRRAAPGDVQGARPLGPRDGAYGGRCRIGAGARATQLSSGDRFPSI